ncbi:pimeloyl-ACP methyl ester carboxylesterase [Curtobacterium sp. PhB130]|uniref:alpha/beta fold hydrolase n=1 Tax=Curtobacterium sp. PhB130 TaxID=2485178 RepID=UPI000F955DA9|nr:alpha/beta hydrolase [Curtobacterium sp. PhB130]ROS74090.1 pimeloyl-ACP methyl ester carboxylesterase [Curtobacterium sp. PhB130]
MHHIGTATRPDVVGSTGYAPYPVTTDPAPWSLTRSVVDTAVGPVVVHARRGPRPLLLLHGVAGSWTTWTPLLRAADGFDGRGLVLVDLPGWGSSPAPARRLDVDDAVAVLRSVLEAVGVDTVDVLGHSMGAFIGMHLAVAAPERVRSTTLVSGTTFAAIDAARHPVRGVLTLPSFALLRAGLAVTRSAAVPLLRGLARVGLLRLLAAPVFTHVRALDRSVLDAFVEELRPDGFLGAARTGAGYDTDRWRSITCPVTAIAGRDDVFARVRDLDDLARVVPQTRTVLLDDCGHFAHVEHPAAVLLALGDDTVGGDRALGDDGGVSGTAVASRTPAGGAAPPRSS